jgi:hypothetical protein
MSIGGIFTLSSSLAKVYRRYAFGYVSKLQGMNMGYNAPQYP